MKSSMFELGLIVRHKGKTLNQTLIAKTSMGPSSLVRKKGKYKLGGLHKKIGKLTAEGTVKVERVAVEAPLPQLPPSFLHLVCLFLYTHPIIYPFSSLRSLVPG